MELWFTMEKYGTTENTQVLYKKIFYFDLRKKKHVRLSMTMKLWLIMAKQYAKTNEGYKEYKAIELWLTMGKTMDLI